MKSILLALCLLFATPAFSQQDSNKVTLTVNNPTPTAASVAPSTAVPGAAALSAVITGTGYNAATTATWGTTALTISAQTSTSLTVAVPATLLATSGTFTITVSNPSPAGGNATINFSVSLPATPVPTIQLVSPVSVSAGAAALTVTFTGTNYQSNAVVNIQKGAGSVSQLTATFVNATSVTAVVPSSLLTVGGTYSLWITNPGGVVAHTIKLQWNASTSTVAGYRIYRAPVSGGKYTLLTSSLVVPLAYVDSTAANGTNPCYQVTAVDSVGTESFASNEACAAVPA